MIIDCDDCAMQHTSACSDYVVSVLLHQMGEPVVLSTEERDALSHLADGGLVAPLRLVPRHGGEPVGKPPGDGSAGGEVAAG